MENSTKPIDAVANLRALAHDLSNSLETVLQAAYLMQMARLDDRNKKWAQVIDGAARDAARINGEIRKILNAQGSVVGHPSMKKGVPVHRYLLRRCGQASIRARGT
jgi:hypothetical protein